MEGCDHRQSPNQFWYKTVFNEILWCYLCEDFVNFCFALGLDRRTKANALFPKSILNSLFQPDKGPTTNEQHFFRVYLNHLLMWMLPATARGDVRCCSFKNLKQCLLNAFTGDITGN